MRRIVTCIALVLAVLAAGPVFADRIIFAPTGTTLSPGAVKAEAATSPSNNDSKVYWLGLGLQKFEVNAIRFDFKNETTTKSRGIATFDTSLDKDDFDIVNAQLGLVPETTLTPAISIGVWDFTDKTADGTGYFLAFSKAVPLTKELPLPVRDVKVHAGFGVSGIDNVFGGAEATLPLGLKVSAEYFQKDFNYALGWGPVAGLQAKVYILDGETYYGLKFSSPL
ncbi:MAG: hypothetical protein ABFD64_13090 [Armatimonadota bacterium]